MKKIPIYSDKKLVDNFIEQARTELEKLSWLGKNSYPAVKVGYREDKSTYPQVYSQNGTFETLDLQPDNSVKSYCFFEKNSESLTGEKRNQILKANLSVIFWYNLRNIGLEDYDFVEQLKYDVYEVLTNLSCYDFNSNNQNPFEKYKINITNNQYLMYPYGAFKINFNRNISICY